MDSTLFIFFASASVALGVAAWSLFRDRGAPGHLYFGLGMLLLGINGLLTGLSVTAVYARDAVYWHTWSYLPKICLFSIWLLFSFYYSRGSGKKLLLSRAIFLTAAFASSLGAVFLFHENLVLDCKPFGTGWQLMFGWSGFLLHSVFILSSALILINLERTFRSAVGTMRWRIKFIVLGVAVIFTAHLYSSSQAVLFRSYTSNLQIVNGVALLVGSLLLLRGLSRANSFKVEVYPSDKVLNYSIVSVLVGAYLLIVVVLARIFSAFTDQHTFPLRAFFLLISLAGLAILLLSDRLRDRLRRFISRHFHRPIYDYRSVWLDFTERSASILNPQKLSHLLATWLSENLNVLSVAVWLVDDTEKHFRLAASTGVQASVATHFFENEQETAEILDGLSNQSTPFDLDRSSEPWTKTLRKCYPDVFPSPSNTRVCVPLRAGRRTLGFVTLGDRVNLIPMDIQDYELLKCIGDQVASNLLNIQLSQRLLQAKEMEAFQTIAAFFVHDLKNTGSTLNLTLQNLPKYWDNPEFRQDAIRAISKSVNHIQELISRLTLFRQKLDINKVEVDLDAVVKEVLGEFPSQAKIIHDLKLQSKITVDPKQIQKVLTNFVLNAHEATKNGGEIQVSTQRQNGWALLTIVDHGCGMSPEFVSRSLFRPFQTTKQGGIGIGMFQSKAIVEAHGGRIEVESEQGVGTTFRILLPAHSN